MKVLSAAPPEVKVTSRSFNAEDRGAPEVEPRPADLSPADLAQRVSELEAWFYSYDNPLSPLADAKSLYTGENLDKLPVNMASMIAGFCLDKFASVRNQIGDTLWNDWLERSYQ